MHRQLLAFVRSNRRALGILIVMSGSYFFAFFHRVAVPGTIFDEIQLDLRFSASEVAMLGAIYLYIYGGMQVFVGIMCDHFGGVRVFLAGSILMNVGALLFPLSHSLVALYGARALVGLGCSLIYVSIVKVVVELFHSEHFAPVLGVAIFIGYSGGLTATLPFERMVQAAGWRSALLILSAVAGVLLLVTVGLLQASGLLHKNGTPFSFTVLKRVLQSKGTVPIIFSASVNFAIYFLVQATIGKKLLSDCFARTSAQAATLTFAMMLTCIASTIFCSFLTKWIGNRRRPIIVTSTGLTVISLLLIVVALWLKTGVWLVWAAYPLLAVAVSSIVVFSAALVDLCPKEATGVGIGVLNGICYVGIALIVNASGWLMDRFKDQAVQTATALVYPHAAYQWIFLFCFLASVVSFIVSFRVHDVAHPREDIAPGVLMD